MDLTKFKSLLGKKHPKQPFIYAVTAGKFLGDLLVYAEREGDDYVFLALPDMNIRRIPVEKFDTGLKDKIVDVVEKLPAYVHKTCIQQYKKNKFNTLAFNDNID
jgi:hypothetical protein